MDSLRGRLVLAATLWIAIGMIAAGIVLSGVFKHHVTKQFYDELYVHLDELQRLTKLDSNDKPQLIRHLSDPRYDVPESGYYWEIQEAGNVLARSDSLKGAPLRTPQDLPTDIGIHTHKIIGPTGTLLVVEHATPQSPNEHSVHFLIGTDQRHLDEVISNFQSTLTWSLAGFGLSMILGATLLILYALRPLNELRSSLAKVRAGTAKSLQGAFPIEVVPLVNELNGLLASTSELIQRARAQAGNLAHGLKTPLAILADEAYRIGQQGLPQSSATILAQSRKMQTQIDYQIARTRAAAMRSVPGTVANVHKAAEDVAKALRRLHGESGVSIIVDVSDGLLAACDPQDLNEMLANVVDNACKHAKSTIRIESHGIGPDSTFRVQVDDDGTGLPPEAFEVVFDIGQRWDSRAAGSGLGLAIVRDLARLYGGDVALEKSSLGGLSVVLTLPAAATER